MRPRRPQVPAGRGREFAIAAAAGFLGWAVVYVLLALLPSYTAAAVGRSDLLTGGGAAGSLLLFAAAAQLVFRTRATQWALQSGLALLAAGLAGLIAAGGLGSLPLLFVSVAVAGAGQGISVAGAVRRVNEIAPVTDRAGTVSLFYLVTYSGSGLTAMGVGLLATVLPLTRAVQLFAAVFAGCALLALAVVRRQPAR